MKDFDYRFDFEIELPVPKVEERHEILKQLLSSINNNVGDSEIESLAKIAHGFVGADLGAVINHAGTRAMLEHTSSSSAPVVTINHLQCALSSVNPTAMREVLVEVPHVSYSYYLICLIASRIFFCHVLISLN